MDEASRGRAATRGMATRGKRQEARGISVLEEEAQFRK